MSDIVYKYENKIFTLKAIGRNDGRYKAYCNRIGVNEDSQDSLVEVITPDGKNMEKPCFYETRYFVRCDFHDSSIKKAFINHKMASVADSFDFDGETLVGTLDFVNSPGKSMSKATTKKLSIRLRKILLVLFVPSLRNQKDKLG